MDKKPSLFQDFITGENDRGSSKKFIIVLTTVTLDLAFIYITIVTGKLNETAFTGLIGLVVLAAGISVADKRINDTDPVVEPNTTTTEMKVTSVETVKE